MPMAIQSLLEALPLFFTSAPSLTRMQIWIYKGRTWELVAQSNLTPCDLMDCSPPGSSVYGIFQARILEWVAISFSRGSSQPRD